MLGDNLLTLFFFLVCRLVFTLSLLLLDLALTAAAESMARLVL